MCAMSGKPATPAASRAGVAGVSGAPRVLVYVADPRQLDPGPAAPDPPDVSTPPLDALYLHDSIHHVSLPRTSFYRPQNEQNDQTNLPNTVFYKSANDNYGKFGPYGITDSAFAQNADIFPISPQLIKEIHKAGEGKFDVKLNTVNIKKDGHNPLDSLEFNSNVIVTDLSRRVPLEAGELSTYQTQCSNITVSDNIMPPAQPIILRHSQNSCEVKSDIERDISVDKSCVNYEFLEQSISHQSVVNQSISILNRQVGVGPGVISEVDSGAVPQFVRTPDGVVLAVLPSSMLAQSAEFSDVGARTAVDDTLETIVVPLGWKRVISGTSVLYISPSGTALSNLPQLREYLQTAGTCKCGLPCPLRPETAFSFDPKVASKPYQAASGAELTRLCNHKRKLLATLRAGAQSPATPPPHQHLEQKKVAVATSEPAMLKKKMKKRPGFPPNMSVSQMMVQRDRPLTEYKAQDSEQNRTVSPGIMPLRPTGPPTFSAVHHSISNNSLDNEIKQETYVQRSSHYLTVSSGWISQQETLLDTGQKTTQLSSSPANSLGLPVLGTNGQIIGVNTGLNKQPPNYKNFVGVSPPNAEIEVKDDKEIISSQQNILPAKQTVKEEESQIFCGLNQPLTPEVMQKINEQQQLFIQQNQKQIELAMKGYRTQISDNVNHNKLQGQNQYANQAQLVIQNGAVVKTNPAKTPPWQVKRNDSSMNNCLTSPSSKPQIMENIDYEESNANISEESLGSNNSFLNENLNQAMCSRVPPLPQHYNMMGQQWPGVDTNKKKTKNNNKGPKKKAIQNETKLLSFGNNGMKLMQDSKDKHTDGMPSNIPSFMDDPNGYLAQQTALLNNTISRQVGLNSTTYDTNNYVNVSCEYKSQNLNEKCGKTPGKLEIGGVYRNVMVPNPSPSPNNVPDSSILSERLDHTSSQCCKGCTVPFKGNSSDFSDQMIFKYIKQNVYKTELENSIVISSPNSFEENPVTSSTFIERNMMINENCSPIQAGTVSTSNVSPMDTLQPPEPSPTPSNSSRGTDTPHSSGSNNSQLQANCTFPSPSPANSCRDNFHSNPSTPGSAQSYHYNSPGPHNNQSIAGTQMMHFISNHNVNKNLMEVDNISMVGVKPGLKGQHDLFRLEPRKRIENAMPGYCPPPHLGGGPAHTLIQACYVQTFVTTMASGFSVTRDTVTSVLAGRAKTATTSINASQANYVRLPPPPSVNLATTYAIPNNQPDPFLNSVNLPTSYPLHIAGTTAQNMISKSPLEMVQNVIGSPIKSEGNSQLQSYGRRICQPATPGQILISSTGQIIVSNNQMPPPPPKTITSMSPIQSSNAVTNVTSVSQVGPTVGGVQTMVNQPAVVVNTLPSPFVIQPSMMAVDGQVMSQNAVLPQIVTGGIVPGQSSNDSPRQVDMKSGQNFLPGVAMLSPESLKKRSKKKKNQTANVTNILHITAPQQSSNNIMMQHSSPQHTSPQFSPRGFQLSPNSNMTPAPMLQALTIVPGKSGTPAHIVMNGQGSSNSFGSQQIITNTSPSQQINLLQPVNLINSPNSVMPNFQAFQQFIVPNLSGMVMTTDGTAIIQDNSTGMPMQLQLQTVNGQNVLTPVQNPGVFTAGANGSVVLRTQKSQHSPGAQFLSPNSQVMMNSPNFNGQLSPLLANLSPTNVTFSTSPHQVRSGSIQAQEFIQTNQMGQTVMVPLSPKQVSLASGSNNRSNPTLVQQNTTIVQQQTTLVSNSHNAQISSITTNLQGGNRLSIDPNILLTHKIVNQKSKTSVEMPPENNFEEIKEEKNLTFNQHENDNAEGYAKFIELGPVGQVGSHSHVRHSVSTQTLVNQQRGKSPCNQAVSGSSPPDTTTHSPLGALEPSRSGSPRVYGVRCVSTQGNYADTTTKSPEPADANSSAMVQCVSSSEQDMAESREHAWSTPRNDFNADIETHSIPNVQMVRQNRTHSSVESTDIHYNHSVNIPANNMSAMPMTSYYERNHGYKRKNEFGDGSPYRNDKIIRTSYSMVHGMPKESDYDMNSLEKNRYYPPSGSSSENPSVQKVLDRNNLGPGNDGKTDIDDKVKTQEVSASEKPCRKFEVGDLVWGPVKGYASWPGKLQGRIENGRWNVLWFGGDKAQGFVEDSRLLTLSEGLEAHHAARTKHRKSRKLNTLLENAIQEAMSELDKKCDSKYEESHCEESTSGENISVPISETPRRSKKHDKGKSKTKHKKNVVKSISDIKSDGSRLRSSR